MNKLLVCFLESGRLGFWYFFNLKGFVIFVPLNQAKRSSIYRVQDKDTTESESQFHLSVAKRG